MQTALIKVWPRWSTITKAGDPGPYVRRVIYTTFLAWRSRRGWAERPTDTVPEVGVEDTPGGLSTALLSALKALPPRQRAVVVCRYLDDLSERQTAELLGCTVGTVKSQSSRALESLRGVMQLTTFVDVEEDT